MTKRTIARFAARRSIAKAILAGTLFATPTASLADEGGVSFWLPGIYGSLAATPLQPGWSFAAIGYNTSVSASGATAASREITIGQLPRNVKVNLNVNLNADVALAVLVPSYVFATPVLGGQLAVGMMAIVGHNNTSLDGNLTATAGPLTVTRGGHD